MGSIVALGTPEQVAETPGSATGEYLARVLRGEPLVPLSDISFAEAAGRQVAHANGSKPTGSAQQAGRGPSHGARGNREH